MVTVRRGGRSGDSLKNGIKFSPAIVSPSFPTIAAKSIDTIVTASALQSGQLAKRFDPPSSKPA